MSIARIVVKLPSIGLSLSIFGALINQAALAAKVTYEFTSKVTFIDSTALGFPASLNGVSVNDPITGKIQYEANSPAAANPLTSVFQLATYYPLTDVSVSINVAGSVFNTWDGPITALVWNNDPTSTFPPGVYDGLLFVNITSPGSPRFKIGNIILPASTFSDETLPSGPVTGIHSVELGTPNSDWLDSGPFNLTQVLSTTPRDYDGDGLIGIGDYDFWRANFGAAGNLAADGNGDGVVDAADYIIWRNSFGVAGDSGASTNARVPEPAILLLLTMCGVGRLFRRHGLCRNADSSLAPVHR